VQKPQNPAVSPGTAGAAPATQPLICGWVEHGWKLELHQLTPWSFGSGAVREVTANKRGIRWLL